MAYASWLLCRVSACAVLAIVSLSQPAVVTGCGVASMANAYAYLLVQLFEVAGQLTSRLTFEQGEDLQQVHQQPLLCPTAGTDPLHVT